MRRSHESLPRPARIDIERQREGDAATPALGGDNPFAERRGGSSGDTGTEQRLVSDVNGERCAVKLVAKGKRRIRDHPAAVLEGVRTAEGCRQGQHGASLGDDVVPVLVGISWPKGLHATVHAHEEEVATRRPRRSDLAAGRSPGIFEGVAAGRREATAAGEGTPREGKR